MPILEDDVIRRFGHRATLLFLFGLVWLMFAVGVITEDLGATPPMIHTYPPMWLRVGMWTLTGGIALYCGLRRSRHDWVGWAALYIMPAFRTISYLVAWFDYMVDDYGGPGLERGWLYSALWLLFVLIIVVCAGWPEPVTPTREDAEDV